MKTLFDATAIAGMRLKNRIVRSATASMNRADDGSVTAETRKLYTDLARGGTGLIITGLTHTTGLDADMPIQFSLTSDRFLGQYAALTEEIHRYGAKIAAQLVGLGTQNFLEDRALKCYGPSDMEDRFSGRCAVPMGQAELRRLAEDFGAAAARAKRCGFDGVQLHAAHGFLLSQFLSPYYNRRIDAYGGPTGNRARLLLEVYEAVRGAVGLGYPVLVKINSADFFSGGLRLDDCLYACRLLDRAGVDAVEISGGSLSSTENLGFSRPCPGPEWECYFREAAGEVAQQIKAPVILVGGNREPRRLNEILNETEICYAALCRPLIREPALPARWQAGDLRPAACISCNRCFSLREDNRCPAEGKSCEARL